MTTNVARWPRAVLFDLDGTLIDSVPDIAAALNVMLAPFGRTLTLAQVRREVGDGARALVSRILRQCGLSHGDAEIDAATATFLHDYHAHPCRATAPYPNVVASLQALRTAGIRLGVCSNKPQDIALRVLDELALRPLFDVVIGAGHYALKPDPEPLLAALRAIGATPRDALYVGDMVMDCQAARAAGVPVALASFGYSPLPVASLGADATFAAWHEFPAVLQALRRRTMTA